MRASSSKLGPPKAMEDEFDAEFNSLHMVQTVEKFVDALSSLSKKVTSFEADGLEDVINDLLRTNESMMAQFGDLDKHKELGDKAAMLAKENAELDNRAKDILRKLIQYRAELKSLPQLPTKGDAEASKAVRLDVEEVLRYGMKLSKFSRAPPSINGGALQTHPNNYIWPAEDALRRGTLAISSLRGDEIIRQELGDDADVHKVEQKDEAPQQEEMSYNQDNDSSEQKPEKVEALNLDLFDPDDENYSD